MASAFCVGASFSSLIFAEASDLLRESGSTDTFLEEASVEMKPFCLSVGASLPVVHWEGLSSWDMVCDCE